MSVTDRLSDYLSVAEKYNTAFEVNDFFNPAILDDAGRIDRTIREYKETGLMGESTMHGAFYDIVPFSTDARIREVSYMRMRQSMEIAARLGVCGVVFHTNYNPSLAGDEYDKNAVCGTTECLWQLLCDYREINIYLENMFDATPFFMENVCKNLKAEKNFGVCLDWAHANIYGRDLTEWVLSLGGYIKHLHINDNNLCMDQHLAVGTGKINWQHFKEVYRKYFEECSMLIETNEPKDQAASLDFLDNLKVGDV